MFISSFYRKRRDITELMELLVGNSQNTVNSGMHKKARKLFPLIYTRKSAAEDHIL